MLSVWHRGKFYLSALMLIAPLSVVQNYFATSEMVAPSARSLPERAVGPWRATLAEAIPGPPYRGPAGERMKDFAVSFRPEDAAGIRGAFLRVGKPRNLRTAGALAHGSPYRAHAHVPMPENLTGGEELWLTVEGWDGQTHQVVWPLADVMSSP